MDKIKKLKELFDNLFDEKIVATTEGHFIRLNKKTGQFEERLHDKWFPFETVFDNPTFKVVERKPIYLKEHEVLIYLKNGGTIASNRGYILNIRNSLQPILDEVERGVFKSNQYGAPIEMEEV